jgi:hypothetical protein
MTTQEQNYIFRHENMQSQEAGKIEHSGGKRNWKTLDENRADFEAKERLEKELTEIQAKNDETYLRWQEYEKEMNIDNVKNYDK